MNSAIQRERQSQKLVAAFVLTGLVFMLLPGTFLGVWNLLSISQSRTAASLSPAWMQAHGHAQIFGWIGSFIMGIGLYSLKKMQRSEPFPIWQGWACLALWTTGVLLRWATNVYLWHWRVLLPVSAILEVAAFLLFFHSVRRHRPASSPRKREMWATLVFGSTFGFLCALALNLALALMVSMRNTGPAFPHGIDQRMLVLCTWGFLVPAIWGFNSKWLPVFIGLPSPSERGLLLAFAIDVMGVIAELFGFLRISALLLLCAAIIVMHALHIFEAPERPAKILNVHRSFPSFVRIAYVWLGIAALLAIWATGADRDGGIWGASRHALTVGFIAVMVFAIGQRVLPAFCGMKILFSPRLMLWSLLLLNIGCILRVSSEIPAYEGYWHPAWRVLPVSAVIELLAVTLFAINIGTTIFRPAKKLG